MSSLTNLVTMQQRAGTLGLDGAMLDAAAREVCYELTPYPPRARKRTRERAYSRSDSTLH